MKLLQTYVIVLDNPCIVFPNLTNDQAAIVELGKVEEVSHSSTYITAIAYSTANFFERVQPKSPQTVGAGTYNGLERNQLVYHKGMLRPRDFRIR